MENDGWEVIIDIIGDPTKWPKKIFDSYRKIPMNFSDRFKCVVFNYINGLNPLIFLDYCGVRGTLLDAPAHRHITQLSRILEDGVLHRHHWYSFNVHNNRWEYLDGETVYYYWYVYFLFILVIKFI